MEQFSKEGRKLRPRRSAAETAHHSEKVEFKPRRSSGEGRPSFGGPRKPRFEGEGRPSFGGPRKPRFEGEGRPSFGGPRKPRFEGEGRPSFGGPRKPRFEGEGRPSFGGPRKPRFEGAGRPSFGGPRKQSFSRRPSSAQFDENSDRGIDRMISRRPQVVREQMKNSDFDAAPTTFQEEVRLNKFIANSGVCSRREADTLIQAGVVTVNGVVVTELGVKVNVLNDDIRFNGERLKGEEKVYLVMNKPKGYVTTASDPHAEKTVMELIKDCSSRVFPVGRLDKNTTGVLMLTNDGEIAERLTHPSYDKKKIYQVILDRELEKNDYDKILLGVTLTDGEVAADELEYIDENDHRKLGIEIHSGKNRIVRRIFESLGYDVRALDRVYFAGLTKKGLKKGEWRYLTEGEANILKMGAYL